MCAKRKYMTDKSSTDLRYSAQHPLVIASRASPLAMAQSTMMRDMLCRAHGLPTEAVRIDSVVTRGDKILDRPLTLIGGKGLFTQEIEDGLRDRRYDLAVHSLKDLPTKLEEGLTLGAIPARATPNDVLISKTGTALADLPHGAKVGTASLRRAAQLRRARPDLDIIPIRGNVQTRISKIGLGEVDAIVLAAAGLERLNMELPGVHKLELTEMLPAVAQGILGIECRDGDEAVLSVLEALNCAQTYASAAAERGFLSAVDGNCRTPLAAHAVHGPGGALTLQAELLHPDGTRSYSGQAEGRADAPEAVGEALAKDLIAQAGPAFLEEIKAVEA